MSYSSNNLRTWNDRHKAQADKGRLNKPCFNEIRFAIIQNLVKPENFLMQLR